MYFNFPEKYLVPVSFEEYVNEEDRIIVCDGCRTFRKEDYDNIFEEADEEFVSSFY